MQLVYKGEDNHIEAGSGSSPKLSLRGAQTADMSNETPDPRGQPVLDRRVSGLKSAQGFRVAVKRIRLFLPGAQSSTAEASLAQGEDSRFFNMSHL